MVGRPLAALKPAKRRLAGALRGMTAERIDEASVHYEGVSRHGAVAGGEPNDSFRASSG